MENLTAATGELKGAEELNTNPKEIAYTAAERQLIRLSYENALRIVKRNHSSKTKRLLQQIIEDLK